MSLLFVQKHKGICKQNIAAVFLNHLPIQNPILWSRFLTELLVYALCALRVSVMPLVRRTRSLAAGLWGQPGTGVELTYFGLLPWECCSTGLFTSSTRFATAWFLGIKRAALGPLGLIPSWWHLFRQWQCWCLKYLCTHGSDSSIRTAARLTAVISLSHTHPNSDVCRSGGCKLSLKLDFLLITLTIKHRFPLGSREVEALASQKHREDTGNDLFSVSMWSRALCFIGIEQRCLNDLSFHCGLTVYSPLGRAGQLLDFKRPMPAKKALEVSSPSFLMPERAGVLPEGSVRTHTQSSPPASEPCCLGGPQSGSIPSDGCTDQFCL